MDFSLFFFADSAVAGGNGYRLLLDSARFADTHGFTAVWTPERHFHPFGGLYPNPAVTGAALAAVTERVGIRAGSVVAPLHHPLRIAEEWAVVDNLSQGRVGVSFASGWHPTDFVLRPETYDERKTVLAETVQVVRRLWRGESIEFADGTGEPQSVRIYPPPVQHELPVWITSAGSADTFRTAGVLGGGVLTHLLGQSPDALAGKITAYREALAETHGPSAHGHVVLMLHTLLGSDRGDVRDLVREPLTDYLRSSLNLVAASAGLLPPGLDPSMVPEGDREFLVRAAFERYYTSSGLFGTVGDAAQFVSRLAAMGVDEVACLIDYGVPADDVMRSLHYLAELIEPADLESRSADRLAAV
jgi:natural product biosynthesis luciferase-like monooxygenase protein